MTKSQIEHKIYDEELSLEELIDIRSKSKEYELSKSDIDYLDEMINDEIDMLDSLELLEEYKEKLSNNNLSTDYIYKVINRSYNITLSKIDNMDKEDIEYLIENIDLDIEKLLRVAYNTKKYNISKDILGTLEETINDQIEELSGEELIKIKKIMKKYNIDTKYINKIINNNKEDRPRISLLELLLLMPHNNKDIKLNKSSYEPFQYEEEELEDDDYFFDDDIDK